MAEVIQLSEIASNSAGDTELRLVLVGKTGVGKSATGNSILGREAFESRPTFSSITKQCKKARAVAGGARLSLIDTPGLYDTCMPLEAVKQEVVRCVLLSAPGPHAFLLVLRIGRFTEEEVNTVRLIQEMFGEQVANYILVLFTHADSLRGIPIEEILQDGGEDVQRLMEMCGHRYHAIDNTNRGDRGQIQGLVQKIQEMVAANGGDCYTNEMYQNAEQGIRVTQEKLMKEWRVEVEQKVEWEVERHAGEVAAYRRKMEDEIIRRNLDSRAKEERMWEVERDVERKVEEIRRKVVNKYQQRARDEAENSSSTIEQFLLAAGPMAAGASIGAAAGILGGPVGMAAGAALGATAGMFVLVGHMAIRSSSDPEVSCCIL